MGAHQDAEWNSQSSGDPCGKNKDLLIKEQQAKIAVSEKSFLPPLRRKAAIHR
jgi:hypothetical protein